MVSARWLAIACAALLPLRADGQEISPGTRAPVSLTDSLRAGNRASIVFDKSLNTYHWTGLAGYANTFGPLFIDFHEQFLSTLIRTDRNLIRDEQSFALSIRRRLNDNLRASGRVSSFVLSDDQSVGIGNASSHAFYGGLEYMPYDRITLEPLVGMRYDNQIDQRDRGPSYLLSLTARDLEYDGYLTNVRGKFQYDRLNPRTLETHADSIIIGKKFFEATRNYLQVAFNRNRRDFYFAADSVVHSNFGVTQNIETRSNNALTISDALDYEVERNIVLTFQGNILTRDVGRSTRYKNFADTRPLREASRTPLNTDIEEFKIDGSVQMKYDGSRFKSMTRFFYQERDERHIVQPDADVTDSVFSPFQRNEERKNNHARLTSLAFDAAYMPSPDDSINISASTNLLRYDTPSLLNDDDRDELSHVLGLVVWHRFNRYLNVRLTAEANLTHLVYLSSNNSANNTWNRIFRLSPRAEYVPSPSIYSMNAFEVLANYTAYDFEYTSATIRSFAFRQFAFVDSTTIGLTKRLAVEWFSHVRLYERGELRWTEFSERPINYFEDKTYIGMIRYQPNDRLLFAAGIRYFSQARFGYVGSARTLETFLRSAGPSANIRWRVGSQTELLLNGWYEHQTFTGQPSRNFTTITMSFNVRI